jgi:hypothetical protein
MHQLRIVLYQRVGKSAKIHINHLKKAKKQNQKRTGQLYNQFCQQSPLTETRTLPIVFAFCDII